MGFSKTGAKEQQILLNLGERSYPIYAGINNLSSVGEKLRSKSDSVKVIIVTNSLIRSLYGEVVEESLIKNGFDSFTITVPEGEKAKSLKGASKIYDRLVDLQVDRFTPLIALGGGVVGDLAGFVAATYMRGIPYIQVPTTLLAQVDSSIGGKVAVNHPRAKNIIGSFYQPTFVLIDITTLKSLSSREFRCGLAEVIKYGFIRGRNFISFLEKELENIISLKEEVVLKTVIESCKIKAHIVERDERDKGERAVLNYGHTIGHALEALGGYEKYLHGEAISLGMVAAAMISEKLREANKGLVSYHIGLVEKAGLPVTLTGLNTDRIMEQIELDKKTKRGKVRFILVKTPGDWFMKEIAASTIHSVLEKMTEGL